MANIALMSLIVIMSVKEKKIIYVPLTMIYQFCMCWGQYVIFYQKQGVQNYLIVSL